ncbi:MAG: tetratricopeptide repeat protein [Proteobacteria bacterium]|nr:tetratricopeptide repeat protein [Pseudomonadota bacterium]
MHLRLTLIVLLAATLVPMAAFAGPKSPSGKNFSGENPLGVSRPEFAATQEGMDLIYQRRYPEALEVFEEMGIDFVDSPVGPIGRSLVWQAWMFENYDFKYERAYLGEYSEAAARLKRADKSGDQKAWIYFLTAVHLGIDAMYDIRKERYLPAFDKAWDALEYVKKVEKLEPEFQDIQLALGLYNYWRSAITDQVDALPDFGDHRAEGLAQMRLAKENGLLARGPASLVLVYSYMEAKDWDKAIEEAKWAREQYPDNLLVEMTVGRVYRQSKKYDDALAAFERARIIDPDNDRLWFQIGEVHYKRRKGADDARAAYRKYLDSKPLPVYEAHTWYRLGMLEKRARRYDAAIALFEKSLAAYPKFKRASERIEQVRKQQADAPKPAPARGRTTTKG